MGAAEKMQPQPKERPTLFSAPMVLALLAGRKTQTRRVVRADSPMGRALAGAVPGVDIAKATCPYGQPGDRLWVRETWRPVASGSIPGPIRYGTAYLADGEVRWSERTTHVEFADGRKQAGLQLDAPAKWRPSIFMRRSASRLTLEVTGVRVERLQDISEEDAEAEGVEPAPFCKAGRPAGMEHVEAFEDIWRSINGPKSWESNPWVWVVSFKRLAG